uniref:Uncharacterized protein n=1 Tax=viral metagenome TaxID=1070528 RepID=A0A6C0L982_9ZZZZ
MNQNAVVTEHTITVNPIYENTVYINDAVSTDIHYVEAVLIDDIPDDSNNCTKVKNIVTCLLALMCLVFILFSLFLFSGGIGLFLTINGGDDST